MAFDGQTDLIRNEDKSPYVEIKNTIIRSTGKTKQYKKKDVPSLNISNTNTFVVFILFILYW